MELVLGTAEFGHPAYAPHPDRKTVVRILNYAWERGIKTLDVSDSYGLDFSLLGGFKQIMKARSIGDKVFYHYEPGEAPKASIIKASVYDLEQLEPGLREVIVPVNIDNTKFLSAHLPPVVYVRGVFGNGQLLKDGYTVSDCVKFVKRLGVTGMIVGVRKVGELEEILEAFNSK